MHELKKCLSCARITSGSHDDDDDPEDNGDDAGGGVVEVVLGTRGLLNSNT